MKRLFTLLLLFFSIGTISSYATHLQNLEINAEHISGNLYRVSLQMVTDCAAISPPNAVAINISNGSSSFVKTLNQINTNNTVSTNYACHCNIANTSCNNGALPGYHWIIFSDTVTLNTSSTWTLSYSTCCRNGSVSNLTNPGSTSQYVETILNQSAFPTNSTPFFPIANRLHISSTDTFSTDLGAIDFEGDSIVYSFVSARENASVNSLYSPGYSGTNPMPGASLNSATGVFTSYGTSTMGSYVMAIEAKEYDRTSGILKSTVVKEFYITNGLPNQGNKTISDTPTPNGFLSSSNGTVSGNQLTLCASSNSTAQISYTSTKGNVQLWSNINFRYPGVTYTTTNGLTSTLNINIPSHLNLDTLDFYVIAGADSSTFTNLRYDRYSIVLGGFSSSGNRTICFGDTVHMSATSLDANPIYQWTYLSGTPIDTMPNSPGYSFSCDNCPNPVISPAVTSQYIVNSVPNTCGQPDTVTITVIQPITLQTNSYDTICSGDSTLISVTGGMTNNLVWEENYSNMNFSGDSMYVDPTSDAYYLIYNPSYLCGDSVYVHVIVPQNVDAGTDESICLGNSVVLNAINTVQANWSPANSLNCTSCANPTATPTQSTMYTVSNDSYGCLSEDSVYVTVETDRYIMGTAFESNGTAMGSTKVLLIAYNTVDSTVSIADSTLTDASGNFLFTTSSDTHYVKVVPDSSTYPYEFPTYYGNQAIFLNATPVVTLACDTSTISITTLADPNPGGSGFIYGNVYQGAGKTDAQGDPVIGARIILVNENGVEMGYSETDANGRFEFSNIALGNYQLFMDAVNAQNQLAPSIPVDENTKNLIYNYKLENGTLIPTTITSIDQLEIEQLVLFPNPASIQIQIMGLSSDVVYTVIGIDGKVYLKGNANSNSIINIESLPKGPYILKATNNTNEFIQRFIKQ